MAELSRSVPFRKRFLNLLIIGCNLLQAYLFLDNNLCRRRRSFHAKWLQADARGIRACTVSPKLQNLQKMFSKF